MGVINQIRAIESRRKVPWLRTTVADGAVHGGGGGKDGGAKVQT